MTAKNASIQANASATRSRLKSSPIGTGEILDIDPGHRGAAADKKIYEASQVADRSRQTIKQADLAYLRGEGVQTPHREPHGGELTEAQREENKALASSSGACRTQHPSFQRLQDRA